MEIQKLTRKNAVLWVENDRWQNGLFIRRAIVWGSQEKITFKEILKAWFASPKKVDVSIMLANMINESSRCPYIARYEIGQHLDNKSFVLGQYYQNKNFEFECTSFGLFQPMGFHLFPKYVNVKIDNVFEKFDLTKQFEWFDNFVNDTCVNLARNYAKSQGKINDLDFIVKSIFAAYAGDVSARNWIIDKKYYTWKSIESKEKFALLRFGFTDEEIKILSEKDKM